MISFKQVRKRYPSGYEALSNVSFDIAAGEMAFLNLTQDAARRITRAQNQNVVLLFTHFILR